MPKSANLTNELLNECLATQMSSTLIADWVVPIVAARPVIASATTAHSRVDYYLIFQSV